MTVPPPAAAALAELEAAWPAAVAARVAAVAADRPGEVVYAAAFWLRYADYRLFGEPCLAINTEGHPTAADDDSRWAPTEWCENCGEPRPEIARLYADLNAALPSTADEAGDDVPEDAAAWDAVWEAHDAVLCRVCRSVTAAARAGTGGFEGLPLSEQFVAAVLDERDEEVFDRLARESLGRYAAEGLIPHLAE